MSDPHPAAIPVEQLLSDCDVQHARRGGPGGQRRNKVSTAAVLTHRPTGLTAQAAERRSQAQNRAAALFRLRLRLATELRTAGDPPREPSTLWRSRVSGGRIAVNPAHDDFPALLAEAMDALERTGSDHHAAAEWLAVTPTQLVKFLKLHPPALQRVNAARAERGLASLR